MATAAIYTRLSQDRDGSKTGTDRQEKDCRSLCKREGLKVGRVYTDDDRSAYSGKPRPSFEEMLGDLDQYDALVYWKTDRLVRRGTQFWRVMDACEQAGVRLISVVDPIDTSTPLGKGVAGMLASMGEQESHNISIRVARKHEELAAQGRPHGHRRAFGYLSDGMTVDKAEAKAIREARDRILAGDAMTAICDDWNTRGIKPTTAPAWRVTTFKRMITGPRIAGLRQYHGEIVGKATWPGIITADEHRQIVTILGDPRRGAKRGRPANYLLTGMMRCGKCGEVMRRGVKGGEGRAVWKCHRVPGDESHCGNLSVTAQAVDDLVEEAILYRLNSPVVTRETRRTKTVGKADDLDALEARVVQLGIDHDDGLISRQEWLARRGPLVERIDAARATLDQQDRTDPLAQFRGGRKIDVRERWAGLDLATRRKIAHALIDRVTILPPTTRGPKFNPDRVKISWKI